ncbi:hypothetical protein LOTGIDRAFT_173857 [Lottia gigantea]|uniref:Uncharacterized protein n=1 Tax=Lottia gigantea TaxID=225164 RepID=V4AVM3_LOTGI|nr:hypothetical protein LOTGIDRAFT_173857 [Lottia gigantea]ESO99115.1 hypothetical protein LOTGIDRAFT_173857 [Lottia gigantea]
MISFNEDDQWNFNSIEDLNQEATSYLRSAMIFERRKRWQKVIECYEKLLWLIDLKHFPEDYEAPPSYDMLLYELYNHLGVAYQHLDRHRKAISQYTRAFELVSIPKNGCLAGCVTNSCLMTPIMTRRAFAYIKIGNLVKALKDAEKAVVLDTKNPDVYCIRALVRSSREESSMALEDLDMALKIKPNHVCALMIRGSISRPLAEKMDPASQNFSTVSTFNHPNILEFFDRFFFTLSVPHTLTEVNLTPIRVPKQRNTGTNSRLEARPKTAQPTLTTSLSSDKGFRCGTASSRDQTEALARRNEYGLAVRKYMCRPKTASDFIAQLERDRQRKAEIASRARTITSQGLRLDSDTRKSLHSRVSSSKSLTFEPVQNYNMPVFTPIDLKNASRMYYKPWKGDKLPVADVKRFEPTPAFY